jgi:hypothetical protein
VVKRGKLAALRAGDLFTTAKLELAGEKLASGAHRCYAGLAIRLGDGVLLVNPAPATTPGPAAPHRAAPAATPAEPGPPDRTSTGLPWWTRTADQPASRPAVGQPTKPLIPWWGRSRSS